MGGHALIGLDNRKVIFMEEDSEGLTRYHFYSVGSTGLQLEIS